MDIQSIDATLRGTSGFTLSQAAPPLGISRDTLRYRLERHGMAAAAAPTRPGGL